MNNSSVTKPSILIVEYHELLRSIIQKWLEELYPDFLILQAGTGEEGVELANSIQPNLILMDIGLPGINGIAATKLIRKNLPHIHVIVLTMFDDTFYEIEAKKAGAIGFVTKSDMYVKLPELISSVMSKPQSGLNEK